MNVLLEQSMNIVTGALLCGLRFRLDVIIEPLGSILSVKNDTLS